MNKIFTVVLCIVCVFSAFPCGWDFDTIAMEKKKFPGVHELISGKFIRHSNEFYYWRIQDRQRKLMVSSNDLNLYDDLGVALDKLGKHDQAIETMLKKLKLDEGKYETHANLGTFYIHNAQYEKGLIHIKKAIEINPEAHFGREVYQQYLVEYIIENKENGKITLPIGNKDANFYNFLKEKHFDKEIGAGSTLTKELSKAIKGVSGMMQFGQYRSPVLLEAIGDLLTNMESTSGYGHLAARAYLKASFEVKDKSTTNHYRKLADEAREEGFPGEMLMRHAGRNVKLKEDFENRNVRGPSAYKLKYLEAALKYEIIQSEKWFDTLRSNELSWISDNLNADSAFSATYFDSPKIKDVNVQGVYKNKLVSEEDWIGFQSRTDKYDAPYFNNEVKLNDSIISIIDEQYARLEKLDEVKANNEKVIDVPEYEVENKDKRKFNWFLITGIGLLGIILFILILKKRKSD